MSTPTNGAPWDARVVIEVMTDSKVPQRVHVWQKEGRVYVSFAEQTKESEVEEVVARGLALIRPLDVAVLFREGKRGRRRFIETD